MRLSRMSCCCAVLLALAAVAAWGEPPVPAAVPAVSLLPFLAPARPPVTPLRGARLTTNPPVSCYFFCSDGSNGSMACYVNSLSQCCSFTYDACNLPGVFDSAQCTDGTNWLDC
ncbi:MAG TPA: hypothetical protein VGM86_24825 [Thermoanaerobaculia bacterium]|jgi:hypothetical protein